MELVPLQGIADIKMRIQITKLVPTSIGIIFCLGISITSAQAQDYKQSLQDKLNQLYQQSNSFVPQTTLDSVHKQQRTYALVDFYKSSDLLPIPLVTDNIIHTLSVPLTLSAELLTHRHDVLAPFAVDSLDKAMSRRNYGLYTPQPIHLLPDYDFSYRVRQRVLERLTLSSLKYFSRYSTIASGLVNEQLATSNLKAVDAKELVTEALDGKVRNELSSVSGAREIKTRYWTPSFESTIQFSQNYMSENWYKGGGSNLTLFTRTYGALTYSKERLQWKNELESKLSIYNSGGDAKHRYQVGEDLLRLQSIFAVRAANKIYYALNGELRTQLWNTYKRNSDKLQTSLLSPTTINVGLGIKFDYAHKSKHIYGRKFSISTNIAPFSYTMRATINNKIDLGRQGLSLDRLSYHRLGSTFRADMRWDINMNLSWHSRLYFNTTYDTTEAEWENTLNMSFGRYFSTRINVNLRFDDGARPSSAWHRYFQINELLSFGFNYRL